MNRRTRITNTIGGLPQPRMGGMMSLDQRSRGYELDWTVGLDVVLFCFGLTSMSEENDSEVSEQEEGFIYLSTDTQVVSRELW